MGRPALDLDGQRFGRLVATNQLRPCGPNGTQRQRLCHCDCGNETWLNTTNLTTGHTKSCGCWLGDFKSLPSGLAARNEVYNNYKADAKRRGLEWLLTDEIFDYIVIQSCHYCGLEPSNKKLHIGMVAVKTDCVQVILFIAALIGLTIIRDIQ